PGEPQWFRAGTDPLPLEALAPDKIRLYARATAAGAPAIDGGRYVATYLRIAVGLQAPSGRVAWASAVTDDVLGGAAYSGGFALCDASGKVTLLDAATGGVVGQ